MSETIEAITNFFTSFDIPNGLYYAILLAGAISLILQRLKKWLEVQSDKVINFMSLAFSFVGVSIDYLVNATSANPAVLGQRTVMIVGIVQLLYQFIIKPGSNFVRDAKAYRESKIIDAPETTIYPESTKSFAVPDEFGA